MASKTKILNLYKALLRESQKFSTYNFRSYAVRRIRDAFRDNRNITDSELINNRISEARKNLDLIKRQALVSQMYQTDKLVIERIPRT
ncbi:unnamed protein product [Ceutorhynchus assimilis]|uniref:Complex 1 LYR protein domain-containing protein n=1 Tax=Ceutorhynchus assimilis TaxID=467358 RepID=A0A9N9MK36_9CUCU|nr:unnamed protein product [Ceutorhynchus assimilis]